MIVGLCVSISKPIIAQISVSNRHSHIEVKLSFPAFSRHFPAYPGYSQVLVSGS